MLRRRIPAIKELGLRPGSSHQNSTARSRSPAVLYMGRSGSVRWSGRPMVKALALKDSMRKQPIEVVNSFRLTPRTQQRPRQSRALLSLLPESGGLPQGAP
jgi:hypothetical protein